MQAGVHKRPRVPNACIRCRQQKIKCSGSRPCGQCTKRSVTCRFEAGNHKVLVDARYIARLQREAVQIHGSTIGWSDSEIQNQTAIAGTRNAASSNALSGIDTDHSIDNDCTLDDSSHDVSRTQPGLDERQDTDLLVDSESPTPYSNDASTTDPSLVNPLLPESSDNYTINADGQPVYLGTSSNWSFGRRVLGMVHERVNGSPLPPSSLHFQGSAYDLGWSGLRESEAVDISTLPSSDYAVFLINAVKFHCSRLFHIFDEGIFMARFAAFHEQPEARKRPPILWFIHYLLVLAFDKAFIVRNAKARSPPGADLFTRAMKLLPDITFLHGDPMQAIEILICAALYLQCLDLRSAAFNVIGQAMRLAVEQGLHTDMLGRDGAEEAVQRCRDIWWTVYILDRRMTSLMGTPLSIADSDISASLPAFSDNARRSLALTHHVQLSKATSTILRTVYGKNSKNDRPFLKSVKDALMTVAEGSDERERVFPLNLEQSTSGLDRLSAYLHIFHHQCLVLATRPLLFFFWQKRLKSPTSFRITAEGGARSLSRVCVSSAKQTLRILKALQGQGLLDSFLPFDREAALSAATVLSLAGAIDESMLRSKNVWLQTAYDVFEEMKARGSVIAGFHMTELQQLAINIDKLQGSPQKSHQHSDQAEMRGLASPNVGVPRERPSAATDFSPTGLDLFAESGDFSSSEDGLMNANDLQTVAEAFDFDHLDYWLAAGNFDGSLASL